MEAKADVSAAACWEGVAYGQWWPCHNTRSLGGGLAAPVVGHGEAGGGQRVEDCLRIPEPQGPVESGPGRRAVSRLNQGAHEPGAGDLVRPPRPSPGASEAVNAGKQNWISLEKRNLGSTTA